MEPLQSVLASTGLGLGYLFVGLLCAAGLVLSCLSLSGTWLVLLGAVVAMPLSGAEFPGWWTLALFGGLAVSVEILEAVAGAWGVQRRGGSGWAGMAALVGGLLGLFLGTWIPIPLVGSLVGMLIGSFALAYAVERRRLNDGPQAAHIARGAVLARLLMIFLKVAVTLGMSAWLWIGIVAD